MLERLKSSGDLALADASKRCDRREALGPGLGLAALPLQPVGDCVLSIQIRRRNSDMQTFLSVSLLAERCSWAEAQWSTC